ncbi:CGNR zinc finger domain-containing protein [Streptomyces sp. GSL17-111]|uniref:CGNR zinc finger domain-containing protein n=1 Tax=Streptomyces sp. GSL17-111 TaxID=3121596 RepID=UPI0030F37B7E
MPDTPDPRPLTGEPLAVDLLNTRWIDGGTPHDLLTGVDGLAVWLADPSVSRALGGQPVPATPDTLDGLRAARAALAAVIDTPSPDDAARDALNAVLAHGRVRRTLEPNGPRSRVEVDDASWYPAWLAADNYLHLVTEHPERLRACANDACVLHFYDVSRNGTRRWCSMAGCGNRAKAHRHHTRHRAG